MDQIKSFLEKNLSHFISIQSRLHMLPEISNEEYRTSSYLKKKIRELGLQILETKGPGFIAIMDFNKSSYIGFRAELDALEIKESTMNLKNPKEVVSSIDGKSHLCGHDFNMASLLGLMETIKKSNFTSDYNLIFIFESGEETGAGKFQIIELLKNFNNIEGILAIHLEPSIESGKFGIRKGTVMAGDCDLEILVRGTGGHASRPDLCRSPIVAGSSFISNIYSTCSSFVNPNNPVVLGIGMIEGGSTPNSIPNSCRILGTLRYFDIDEGLKITKKIKEVSKSMEAIYGCEFIVNNMEESLDSPTVNDSKLADIAYNAVFKALGENYIVNIDPFFSSESFNHYNSVSPIMYLFLGTKDLEKGYGSDLHSDKFDFDKSIIYNSIIAMISFTKEFEV